MKLIQIRNVPDDVHQTLKERAAAQRTSLSDMLLVEIERLAHLLGGRKSREPLDLDQQHVRQRRALGGGPFLQRLMDVVRDVADLDELHGNDSVACEEHAASGSKPGV